MKNIFKELFEFVFEELSENFSFVSVVRKKFSKLILTRRFIWSENPGILSYPRDFSVVWRFLLVCGAYILWSLYFTACSIVAVSNLCKVASGCLWCKHGQWRDCPVPFGGALRNIGTYVKILKF